MRHFNVDYVRKNDKKDHSYIRSFPDNNNYKEENRKLLCVFIF